MGPPMPPQFGYSWLGTKNGVTPTHRNAQTDDQDNDSKNANNSNHNT